MMAATHLKKVEIEQQNAGTVSGRKGRKNILERFTNLQKAISSCQILELYF